MMRGPQDEDRLETADKDIREREIVAVERRIEANPPPGCLVAIVQYLGLAAVLAIVGMVIGLETGFSGWTYLIQPVGLLGYMMWWHSKRDKVKKLRDQLNKLLDEEQQEIKATRRGSET